MSIVAKRRMDEDATWHGSRPRPRPQCVRRGDAAPPRKGHSSPRLFLAHVYCGHGRPSQLLVSSCCTGHDIKCQYFTMGAPIHQNCPFLWEIWTLYNTWFLGVIRAHNPNGTSIGSDVFAQMTAECPYTLQWFARFPLKIARSRGYLDPWAQWRSQRGGLGVQPPPIEKCQKNFRR